MMIGKSFLFKSFFKVVPFLGLTCFISISSAYSIENKYFKSPIKKMFFAEAKSKKRIEITSKCFLPASDDFTFQDYERDLHRKYFSVEEKGAEVTFIENNKVVGTAIFSCAGLHPNGQGYMGLETFMEYGVKSKPSDAEETIFYTLTVAQEEMSPGSIDYRYLNFSLTSEGKKALSKNHFLQKWDETFMNTSDNGVTSSK